MQKCGDIAIRRQNRGTLSEIVSRNIGEIEVKRDLLRIRIRDRDGSVYSIYPAR